LDYGASNKTLKKKTHTGRDQNGKTLKDYLHILDLISGNREN
jgi:hypothetical protein